MKLKNILIVFCVLILFECQPNNVSKKSLKQRVNEYYSELIKGEYGKSWDFLWKEGRRKWTRAEWVDFVHGASLLQKMIGTEIKSVSIKILMGKRIGLVKGVGMYFDMTQRKIVKNNDEELWLFEDDNWFRIIE